MTILHGVPRDTGDTIQPTGNRGDHITGTTTTVTITTGIVTATGTTAAGTFPAVRDIMNSTTEVSEQIPRRYLTLGNTTLVFRKVASIYYKGQIPFCEEQWLP
jgi:hypothetical protein